MGKISRFIGSPWWKFLSAIVIIFGFFGIKAQDIMNLSWIEEAFKWSLWVGMFIFSIHAYYRPAKPDDILNTEIANLRSDLWGVSAVSHRCMAYIFEKTPSVSYIYWLRAAQYFNATDDVDNTRIALQEAFKHLKVVDYLLPTEVGEIQAILNSMDLQTFQYESKGINEALEKLINKPT